MLMKSQIRFVTWQSYYDVAVAGLVSLGLCLQQWQWGVCSAFMRLWWLSLQSVLDEMMVEQTDLVRLRMVRMSNVPDTLYMVNNAVPQCCHVITHQQVSTNQTSPPSVIANEIPGKLWSLPVPSDLLGVRGGLGLGGSECQLLNFIISSESSSAPGIVLLL